MKVGLEIKQMFQITNIMNLLLITFLKSSLVLQFSINKLSKFLYN